MPHIVRLTTCVAAHVLCMCETQEKALQPLPLEAAARQQPGASRSTLGLRLQVPHDPVRQHNVDRWKHKQTPSCPADYSTVLTADNTTMTFMAANHEEQTPF